MAIGSRGAVIIEDDRLFASLIATLLEENGFSCHLAHNAREAKALLKSEDIDVAIIDIHLGDGPSGIHLAKSVEITHPGVGVVFLTNTPDYLSGEVNASDLPQHFGVAGKDTLTSGEELLDAIESVLSSKRKPIRHDKVVPPALTVLTPHQRKILKDVAAGLTNQAIATRREVTTRSVERTLQTVFDRLEIPQSNDINRRAVAIRRYVEAVGFPPSA